ncbi:MAG: DHH family phosphoesterase [Candidatus Diapherotrites archaeon]|nr:DHH family phosphoesterase [Candidatus Diapherotrites archaeon]
MKDEYDEALSKTAKLVKGPATLVFHDDADGLCAAALADKAMQKLGLDHKNVCIEKAYPEILGEIQKEDRTIIYLDIASGEVDALDKLAKTTTIIIDHHKTGEPKNQNITNLDPELFGYSGDTDASASTIAYAFFSKLTDLTELKDLTAIGSCEIPGEWQGINKEICPQRESKTKYGKKPGSVAKDLTILGSVGYYQQGFRDAIKLCHFGYNKELRGRISELEEKRKEVNRSLARSMKLNESRYTQWFFAGNAYKGMGTKVIGTFCSYLSHRGVAQDKILLGFMDVENAVPGTEWRLRGDYVKVSARAPEAAATKIVAHEWPGLGTVLKKACANVGGFGDGHDLAASGIVPRGREAGGLVHEIESLIAKGHGTTLADFV